MSNPFDRFDSVAPSAVQNSANPFDRFDESALDPEEVNNQINASMADRQAAKERNFFNNAARGAGERGASLAGNLIDAEAAQQERMAYGPVTPGSMGMPNLRQHIPLEQRKQERIEVNKTANKMRNTDLGYDETRNTLDGAKAKFSKGDYLGAASELFAAGNETLLTSAPDMLGAALPPVTLQYVQARTGEIANENAKNQGKELADADDIARAAPFAIASTALERILPARLFRGTGEVTEEAAREISDQAIKHVLKRAASEGGQSAAIEGGTEFIQEGVIEYIGQRYGTDAAMDVKEALAHGVEAAILGSVGGGTLGSGRGAYNGVSDLRQASRMDQRDPDAEQDGLEQEADTPAGDSSLQPALPEQGDQVAWVSPDGEQAAMFVAETEGPGGQAFAQISIDGVDSYVPMDQLQWGRQRDVAPEPIALRRSLLETSPDALESEIQTGEIDLDAELNGLMAELDGVQQDLQQLRAEPIIDEMDDHALDPNAIEFEPQQVPAGENLSLAPLEQNYDRGIDYASQPNTITRDHLATGVQREIDKYIDQTVDAYLPEGAKDRRLMRERYRIDLDLMAKELAKGGNVGYTYDEHGRINGRTGSINPEWFKSMDGLVTTDEAKKAVQKALAGEKLGTHQAAVIENMLDEISLRKREGAEADIVARWEARKNALTSGDPEVIAAKLEREQDHLPDITPAEALLVEIVNDAIVSGVNSQEAEQALQKYAGRAQGDTQKLIAMMSGWARAKNDGQQQNSAGAELPAGYGNEGRSALTESAARTHGEESSDLGIDQARATEQELDSLFGSSVAPANNPFDQFDDGEAIVVADIDTAANEAATSPLNDLPEPTQAQKDAGNYRKGKIRVQGLEIAIENPRGSIRSGVDPDGKQWSNKLHSHYGYIRRTEASDGDAVDVFVGPNPSSEKVFVVDQVNADGTYDESKVLIGFDSKLKARSGYKSNYSNGWKVGPITSMSMNEFKEWVKSGNTKKPLQPNHFAGDGKKVVADENAKPAHHSSLTPQDIQREINRLIETAKQRVDEEFESNHRKRPPVPRMDLEYLTSDEKARMHELKQALPSQGEEVIAAKSRLAQRIQDRKAAKAPIKQLSNNSDLPPILTNTKSQHLKQMAAEQGAKKGSPGYADAMARLEDQYEIELDRAQASLSFEKFNELNRDTPENLNRQAHRALRKEFGLADDLAVNESSGLYSADDRNKAQLRIKQPERGDDSDPQWDLFAPRNLRSDTSRQQSADNFHVRYEQVATSTFPVGISKVSSPEDAAHVFAPLRKHAQESFLVLVTDDAGKILNLIRHTKGAKDASSVYPAEVIGAIASTPGASKVWFGHNHPSGKLDPSGADHRITERLIEVMDGMGLDYQGHVIVGEGRNAAYFHDNDRSVEAINITPAPRVNKVSVTERVIKKRVRSGIKIDSPTSALKLMRHVDADSAIVLLDTQLEFLGSIAMSPEEMGTLREGGRVNRIVSALGTTNAAAVIIKTDDTKSAKNVARFINGIGDIRMLDWFSPLASGGYRSDAEYGGLVIGSEGTFFSLASNNRSGADVSRSSSSISEREANEVIRRIRSGIKRSDLTIEPVRDFSGFPPEVQEYAKREGYNGEGVEGVFHDGSIYLNLSALPDAKSVERVTLHELYGHYGIRQLFGTSTKQAMGRLYLAIGGAKGINELSKKLNIDLSHYANPLFEGVKAERHDRETAYATLAEELLAHIAQDNKPSVKRSFKELLGALRSWLRNNGFLNLSNVSDSELIYLLKQARQAVNEGRVTGQPGLLFMLAGTGRISSAPAFSLSELSRQTKTIIGNDPLLATWTILSLDDAAFQLPVSQKHSLEDIFGELEPGVKIRRAPEFDIDGAKVWAINPDRKTLALVFEKGDSVWIDVADYSDGQGGRRIYNAVANYTHNTGKTFVGDPAGLSDKAMARRLENMISSALKFGTTRHLWPHERQEQGGAGVKPIKWKDGDDAYNLKEMINASSEATLNQFPEIRDLRYNPRTDEIEGVKNGKIYTRGDIEAIAKGKRASAAAGGSPVTAGGKTLERAILTHTILRGTRQEQFNVLAGLGNQRSQRLSGVLYSLKQPDSNPEPRPSAGVSVSGVDQTKTPAFNKWFGSSKMVDAQGKPLIVYHGTASDFDAFSKPKAQDRDGRRMGMGWGKGKFYFAETGEAASSAAQFAEMTGRGRQKNVMPVYLSVKKPMAADEYMSMVHDRVLAGAARDSAIAEVDKMIRRDGYDGIIDADSGGIAVFEPEQIKSAIGNTGAFDPGNPDIRFSLAGSTLEKAKNLVPKTAAQKDRDLQRASLSPSAQKAFDQLGNKDQTIIQKIRREVRRQVTPAGLLPDDVYRLKIERDSQFNADEIENRVRVKAFNDAVEKAYGKPYEKLSPAIKARLNNSLKGEPGLIPADVKKQLDFMREEIKRFSNIHIRQLIAEVKSLTAQGKAVKARDKLALLQTISENLDTYLHRSYRAFDDENWPRKVPPKVFGDAVNYLAEQYADGEKVTDEHRDRANKKAYQMLHEGTAFDSMSAFISEGKLGAKDLSIIKRRKDIAPEIRALLGEYEDAPINYVKSATKMARLVFNHEFLTKLQAVGFEQGFLFDKANTELKATRQIAGDGSEVYAPLNGLYTYPEFERALNDALGKENMAGWYRTIIAANGMVKFGKTVLSPTTAMRNFYSAFFFSMANGHFDLSKVKNSISIVKTYFTHSDDDGKEYMKKLRRLGVVYDSPYASEMMELLKDSRLEETALQWKPLSGVKGAIDYAQKFYSFGDDFWKIIGFENEKALLIKHKRMGEAEAEIEAAERIRNTYPTYSMTGRAVNSLRRFPLVGTFVSFPAEIIRTSYHITRYMVKDMKESRAMGMQKLAGFTIAAGAIQAMSLASKALLGVDDDEEAALRALAPEWQRNSSFLYWGRDDKGSLQYLDLSFLDPYNYWKRPVNAVLRDQPIDEAVKDGAWEMLGPFFGQDIAFGAITESITNKKSSGGRIFNPEDDALNQTADISAHLVKAFQPGIASNLSRIYDASQGRITASGKKYDMGEELVALAGFRMGTFDPKTALYYQSFGFMDRKRNASTLLNTAMRDPNKTRDGELRDAYERSMKARERAYSDMINVVNAGKKAGMTHLQIVSTLRNSGVTAADSRALARGEIPRWKPSKTMMAGAIKKAAILFDQETADEFKRREHFIKADAQK